MIRPIGIQYTDFRHGRITFFIFSEIIPDMQKVPKGHSQGKGIIQLLQPGLFHLDKAVQHSHIRRLFKCSDQRIRFHAAGLSGIHRIDTICLDPVKLLVRDISTDQVSHCGFNVRFFVFLQKLHALYGRIRSLVKLSRKKLH